MNKQVMILRHAKSDWPENTPDRDRGLAKRGRHNAAAIAKTLKSKNLWPDKVLCSSARRTVETFSYLQAENENLDVDYSDALYLASQGTLLSHIQDIPDNMNSIMLVGHNPGMHMLAMTLMGQGPADLRNKITYKYVTGCLSIFEFGNLEKWADIQPQTGVLTHVLIGKECE